MCVSRCVSPAEVTWDRDEPAAVLVADSELYECRSDQVHAYRIHRSISTI